jgi:hypothetical protein
VLQLPGLFGIGSLTEIPAGEKNYVMERSATMPVDVKVYLANPHAHYLGKEFKARRRSPTVQRNRCFGSRTGTSTGRTATTTRAGHSAKGHASRRPHHLRQHREQSEPAEQSAEEGVVGRGVDG